MNCEAEKVAASTDTVEASSAARLEIVPPTDCSVSEPPLVTPIEEPVKDRLEPLMVRAAPDWTARPAEPVKDRLEPAAIERVVPPLTVTALAKCSRLANVTVAARSTIVAVKVSTQLSSVSCPAPSFIWITVSICR